jgi:hypothetical protein
MTFFAGVTCIPCQEELKTIRDRLPELGAAQSRVNVRVYVVLGKFNRPVQPGDETKFAKDHGLPFEMGRDSLCADNGPYRKYWSEGCGVPKAVMETPDGKLIPNRMYLESNADRVMSDLKESLGLQTKEKK